MEIKRQNLNIGKAVFDGDVKSGAEGSIIVPDVKPDILKILQADADAFLTEKSIDGGRLVLKGKLNVNVLYLPEGAEGIECIRGSFEFCETVKNAEFQSDMQVSAVADTKKVGYRLINSRKVGINAEISVAVQVYGSENISIVCDVEDEFAEIMSEEVCVGLKESREEFVFNIEESVTLQKTKPEAIEILKSNVTLCDKECRALSGKLVLKGNADVSLLYLSKERTCEQVSFELPFTEVFDVDGLSEESEFDVTLFTEETDAVLSEDMGDGQCIGINCSVRVLVRTENCENRHIITDCYFTNTGSNVEYIEFAPEQTVARPALSCIIKAMIEKEENQPEISGIYTAVAKPEITSTQLQNGKIAVSGKNIVYVLYTSESAQNPVCGINEEIPFSYMLECAEAEMGDDVLLMAECEHISCTINSPGAFEIRCGMCVKGRIVRRKSVKAVCTVSVKEPLKKESAVVVYFAKKGDSIWEIGKNYHVPTEKILEVNGLLGDENLSGEKLIIPII